MAKPNTNTSRPSRSGIRLPLWQQAELRRMHAAGDYSIADLAELFTVSPPTVYRTLQRSPARVSGFP